MQRTVAEELQLTSERQGGSHSRENNKGHGIAVATVDVVLPHWPSALLDGVVSSG